MRPGGHSPSPQCQQASPQPAGEILERALSPALPCRGIRGGRYSLAGSGVNPLAAISEPASRTLTSLSVNSYDGSCDSPAFPSDNLVYGHRRFDPTSRQDGRRAVARPSRAPPRGCLTVAEAVQRARGQDRGGWIPRRLRQPGEGPGVRGRDSRGHRGPGVGRAVRTAHRRDRAQGRRHRRVGRPACTAPSGDHTAGRDQPSVATSAGSGRSILRWRSTKRGSSRRDRSPAALAIHGTYGWWGRAYASSSHRNASSSSPRRA